MRGVGQHQGVHCGGYVIVADIHGAVEQKADGKF
jgi:hypothetical protein